MSYLSKITNYIQHSAFALFLFLVHLPFSYANNNCNTQYTGINLAGAGFAPTKIPGIKGHDYKFPNNTHLKYYSSKGFNSARLSITWERIQPALYSELNNDYLNSIKNFLENAKSYNMNVILDLHNYGRYRDNLIGSNKVPESAFFDIWKRLAHSLKDYSSLYAYGLMNEPHDTDNLWHRVAQSGVDAIRSIDKKRIIYVSGDFWSSAELWPKINPRPFVTDLEQKVVYEAHVYFDENASGKYQTPDQTPDSDIVDERLMPFIKWLQKHDQKGVIGEWGVPTTNPEWFKVVDRFIFLTQKHCLNWYIWSGGQWSKQYVLSLEPDGAHDKPLTAYLSKKTTSSIQAEPQQVPSDIERFFSRILNFFKSE